MCHQAAFSKPYHGYLKWGKKALQLEKGSKLKKKMLSIELQKHTQQLNINFTRRWQWLEDDSDDYFETWIKLSMVEMNTEK
jgi:hypothetical protein